MTDQKVLGLTMIPEAALDPELIKDLPVEWARTHCVLPVRLDGRACVLASDTGKIAEIEYLELLTGLDLEVPRGSCTAVLGASGCGKTTLLRIVAGLETADSGRVTVAGTGATLKSAATSITKPGSISRAARTALSIAGPSRAFSIRTPST